MPPAGSPKPWQAPAPAGASQAVDMQARAKACVTRMAVWVVELGKALDAERKLAILDRGDRKRIIDAHAWAQRWLAADGKGTVHPPHKPGGDLMLHIPMGTIGEADEDGEAVGLGFQVVGPDASEAYYIEKLAHRYRLLLPEHLRPERAPNRKGNA